MPQPLPSLAEPRPPESAPGDRDILDVEPMLRNFGGLGPTVTMLYALFLENADELSRRLKDRLAAGDLDGARLAAHSAAGAARTAGAGRVASLFASVEEAALHGDMAVARRDTAALDRALADVKILIARI
ncbi:Hpt domain-containing protein [Azospirillum isscasi]|uniref:Hpt domain-containing protein n=1 Tax=Azospirillum isscasi TaxID=3053926 RepID=A0ABU0WCZ9_9PROT|nr:Hpt domain-containing protein [Azospirillum isscasi]MDQ2102061.1 Hpt domain-containing protein [Azospirillum isscasi]